MLFHDIQLSRLITHASKTREDFSTFCEHEIGYAWDGSAQEKVHLLREYFSAHPEVFDSLSSHGPSRDDSTQDTGVSGSLHSPRDDEMDLTDRGLDLILDLESRLIGVLLDMEQTGVQIDLPRLSTIGDQIETKIRLREQEIYDLVGVFNIASPKQIQELFQKLGIRLTKKNKTGYSVDTEVLEELAREHDIARLILDHRTLSKLSSTYIDGLSKAVKNGKIHTTYQQLGAATGRMSSLDPNLQNIPAGDGYGREIKSCFIPSAPDHLLIVADYSQIELRILAWLSGDPGLIEAFDRGEDIHTRTARFIFGSESHISSDMRRVAKSVNFGVIYGITGFGLSRMIGSTPREATLYIERFFQQYPGVREYYDRTLENGRQDGFVSTYYGRRRYIPSLSDANKTIRSVAEREAINMPIQGTAADILKIAMIRLSRLITQRGFQGKMILQVHDELVFDVPESEAHDFAHMIREVMEHIIPEHSGVDLTVDIHTGKNWAEAKG